MADDEVLFDEVYELCEVIGNCTMRTMGFIIRLALSFIFLFITINEADDQEILLESTIVRCSQDEMLEDGTPKNPLQLASSFKNLNLKFYSKCRKKLLITLRVTESSRDFVPDALILIDQAKNILTHKSSRFGLPIAVKFHQEVLLQKYPLKYLYRVNGKMYEEVINSENSKNYTSCSNSLDQSQPPTCGYVPGSSPKKVAGFCCSCQEHRSNVQQRGGQRCDMPHKTAEQLTSAHCLRSSPYWYNVYELFTPSLYQKITFEIFRRREHRNGSIFWERMSENRKGVEVDSDTPSNAAGAMKITYRPHVEGISRSAKLFDSSSQRLLFPVPYPIFGTEKFPYPEPLKGAIEDQMLIIPKTLMSPHGVTCDHVGTQMDAFLNQKEPCRQERNACLKNQPFDLWKQDQGPRGDPKSRFRLSSYQTNYPPIVDFAGDYKSGWIYVEHKADAPTYVDIEIPADDLVILSPGYNAFIESVLTDTGSEGAKVVIHVFNKELVEAAFTVELVQCSLNLSPGDEMSLNVETKSSQKKIGPLNAKYFHLDLHSSAFKLPMYCYISLINEHGESVAAREVTLKPYETCLCVHTCKCACGEIENVKCEKMSEENIVATGLISTIKIAAAQQEAEDKSRFTRKYRWIFHWILVFHIFLLVFAILGWLQKLFRKPKPKIITFPKHSDSDDLNSSGSSDTSEITLYDKVHPSNSKLLEDVFDSKLNISGDNANLVNSKSTQIIGNMSATETQASQVISKSTDAKNIQTDNSGVGGITFASQTKFKEPSTHGSNITVNTVLPSGLQSVAAQKSGVTLPSNHSSPNPSMPDSTQGSKTTQHSADLHSLSSPKSATEQSIIPVQSNTSRNEMINQTSGPQATDSSDIMWTNNNDENSNNIESFIQYCVSASSSKTSFGTWHRKKRDQYSAYDFLPEPKQKGWFS